MFGLRLASWVILLLRLHAYVVFFGLTGLIGEMSVYVERVQ